MPLLTLNVEDGEAGVVGSMGAGTHPAVVGTEFSSVAGSAFRSSSTGALEASGGTSAAFVSACCTIW